jgi:hypothetical protein
MPKGLFSFSCRGQIGNIHGGRPNDQESIPNGCFQSRAGREQANAMQSAVAIRKEHREVCEKIAGGLLPLLVGRKEHARGL